MFSSHHQLKYANALTQLAHSHATLHHCREPVIDSVVAGGAMDTNGTEFKGFTFQVQTHT